MDNALYVGLQHQRVLATQLDIVANNLANASTSGFKAEISRFAEAEVEPAGDSNRPHNVLFVRDVGLVRNLDQGAVLRTENPLDLAIEGDGFFTVQGPAGRLYTRDGGFALDPNGALVTKDGLPVLDSGGAPIVIPQDGGPLGIGADGTVTAGEVAVGQIGIARFERPEFLLKTGANRYEANGETAGAAETSRLVQGALEGSNVNPVLEITRLIEISRAYESAARFQNNADELRGRAIERLGRPPSNT